MNRLRDLIAHLRGRLNKQPARVAAVITSSVLLGMAMYAPDIPAEPMVTLMLGVLGLGEYAQRVEDKKTADALATAPPAAID